MCLARGFHKNGSFGKLLRQSAYIEVLQYYCGLGRHVVSLFPRLHILSTSAEVHSPSTISFLLVENILSSQKKSKKPQTDKKPFNLGQIEEQCTNLKTHRNFRNSKGVTCQCKIIIPNLADSRSSFSSEHGLMIQGGPCITSKH